MEKTNNKKLIQHILISLIILTFLFYLIIQIPFFKSFYLTKLLTSLLFRPQLVTSYYEQIILKFTKPGSMLYVSLINLASSFVFVKYIFQNALLIIPTLIYIVYTIINNKNKKLKIISLIAAGLQIFVINANGLVNFINPRIQSFITSLFSSPSSFLFPYHLKVALFYSSFPTTIISIIQIIVLLINIIFFIIQIDIKRIFKILLIICVSLLNLTELVLVVMSYPGLLNIIHNIARFECTINPILIISDIGIISLLATYLTIINIFLTFVIVLIINIVNLIKNKDKKIKIASIIFIVIFVLFILTWILSQIVGIIISVILFLITLNI